MILFLRICEALMRELNEAHDMIHGDATDAAGVETDAAPAASTSAAEPTSEGEQNKAQTVEKVFDWLNLISSTRLPKRVIDESTGEPAIDKLADCHADMPEFVPRTAVEQELCDSLVDNDPTTLPGFNPQLSMSRRDDRRFFEDSAATMETHPYSRGQLAFGGVNYKRSFQNADQHTHSFNF